jgi:hypothetical protein
MAQKKLLNRISGLMPNELIWKWRKIYKEKLHSLYYSPTNVGMIRCNYQEETEHVEETRNVYKTSVAKCRRKRLHKGTRCR